MTLNPDRIGAARRLGTKDTEWTWTGPPAAPGRTATGSLASREVEREPALDLANEALHGSVASIPRSSAQPAHEGRIAASLRLVHRCFAVHDALLLGYLLVVSALLLRADASPDAAWCARAAGGAAAALILACVFARASSDMARPAVRSVAYRAVIVGVLLFDYLMLRRLLPVLRPDSLDAALLHVDELLFGVEPALWLERLNHRPVVEWFSFFYFSYFPLCAAYMIVVVWVLPRGRATTEFAVGTVLVYCIGQLGYVAVPGYGPIHFLADRFQAPVDGGFFWSCVVRLVDAGSAMKDIFPSLHTAAPTWFALYAARTAASDARFRWPARLTGFFAANIVVSTMVLRWHYAIDVAAGLALAFLSAALAPRIATWEAEVRARLRQPGVWTSLEER